VPRRLGVSVLDSVVVTASERSAVWEWARVLDSVVVTASE
jgi:hypothetical protein